MSDEWNKNAMLMALEILSTGLLRVYVDPRLDDNVMLPDELLTRWSVLLQYGFDVVPPIPDLTVTDVGISGTLSFGGKAFETFVPWEAVTGIEIESGEIVLPKKKKKKASALKIKIVPATSGSNVVYLDDYKKKQGI